MLSTLWRVSDAVAELWVREYSGWAPLKLPWGEHTTRSAGLNTKQLQLKRESERSKTSSKHKHGLWKKYFGNILLDGSSFQYSGSCFTYLWLASTAVHWFQSKKWSRWVLTNPKCARYLYRYVIFLKIFHFITYFEEQILVFLYFTEVMSTLGPKFWPWLNDSQLSSPLSSSKYNSKRQFKDSIFTFKEKRTASLAATTCTSKYF